MGYALMAAAYGILGFMLMQTAIFTGVYAIFLARGIDPLAALLPLPITALSVTFGLMATREFANGIQAFRR
jgi:hypothetical protein